MKRFMWLGVVLFVLSCGESTGSSNAKNANNTGTNNTNNKTVDQPLLQVEPASAPPGQMITVRSDELDLDALAPFTVEIAGQILDVARSPEGTWVAPVPILFQDGWHVAPDAPVDVVLLKEEPIARAPKALTIEELPEAPGAARQLQSDLVRISDGMTQGLLYGLRPGPEQQHAVAVANTLDTLLNDEVSGLEAALAKAEAEPEVFRLLEALLASSGTLASYTQYADGLEELAKQLPVAPINGLVIETTEDQSIAVRMQYYVIVKAFADEVIHATANTFALTVGTFVSGLQFFGFGEGVVATTAGPIIAIVGVFDFFLGKYVLALFPAEVVELGFDLAQTNVDFEQDILPLNARIVAQNAPPIVTWNDMLSYFLTVMGLAGTASGAEAGSMLVEQWDAVVGLLQGYFAAYAEANPNIAGVALDFDFTTLVEDTQWEANLVTPSLVAATSSASTVVQPDGFGWRSTAQGGQADLRLVTAGNDGATLTGFLGAEYNGGAFGEEAFESGARSVFVGPPLVIEVEYPQIQQVGEVAALVVRAGVEDVNGNPTWTPGLQVDLQAVGATLDVSSGVTDANGEFTALVNSSQAFAQIVITVTDSLGQVEERTVTSNLLNSQGSGISECRNPSTPREEERRVGGAGTEYGGTVWTSCTNNSQDATTSSQGVSTWAITATGNGLVASLNGSAQNSAIAYIEDTAHALHYGYLEFSFETTTPTKFEFSQSGPGIEQSFDRGVRIYCDLPTNGYECNITSDTDPCPQTYSFTLEPGRCFVTLRGSTSAYVDMDNAPGSDYASAPWELNLMVTPQ